MSPIGLYTDDDELPRWLRESCPDHTFETGEARTGCAVAIVDRDAERGECRSLARVVLRESAAADLPQSGELVVEREVFLRNPQAMLHFAGELAGALLRASALEQEAIHLREIHDLMTMVDAEAVSERITSTVLELVGLPHGTLLLHDPRFERYMVSYTNDASYRESSEFLPGIPPDALQKALASPSLFAAWHDPRGRTGLMVMPLQVQEDLLGVIRIPLRPGHELGETEAAAVTRYLRAVAQVLGNIYQLTRSRDLAMRDDLTKAYNRRFFDTYLDEEIERSRRYGHLCSIIFLDLDDLRMVNNFYGHLSGSRTLQEVAKRILAAVRGIDKVVRFGGDEFCVILPQTDPEQAVAVANRIARSIASSPLHIDPTVDVTITASFGIASYPTHALTKDALIRKADAAMYRVKSTTKNAVGIAEVEDATRPV